MATELREDSRYHEIDTIFWSSALAFGMSDRKNPSEALRSPIIGVVELASIGTPLLLARLGAKPSCCGGRINSS
jgi:hypothetical protein